MTRPLSRPWYIALLCVLCLWLTTGAYALAGPAQQTPDAVLYVNNQHSQASDSNPGTQDKPLKTIANAAGKARTNRKNGRATVIRIADGMYREAINLTLDEGSPITFEAINPGKAIISGSDIWRDWKPGSNGVYTRAWPHNWGVEPNPWADDNIDVPTIVRRREMIFVNGQVLRQVLTAAELTAGTFLIEEDKDLVTVKPPSGVDLNKATVEVAMRDRIFLAQHGNNLTVRGLVFQHGNEALDQASVWIIDARNVLVEDCLFQWNNAVGLKFSSSDNVTARRNVSNFNGIDGMGGHKLRNLLMENNVTAYNNWRGEWGDFYGWAIGQKFMLVHGGVIRGHQSYGNESRGFWLDTDNVDVLFEGGTVRDNRRDGLFIEANAGPIIVKQSTFGYNGSTGVLLSHSRGVTLEGNTLCNNSTGQLRLSGTSSSRDVPNWETGEVLKIYTTNTKVTGNTLVGITSGQLLFTTSLPQDPWNRFVQSLNSNTNRWYNTASKQVFQVTGGKKYDLPGWQSQTGQDKNSTFADPGPLAACQPTAG